MPSEPLRQRALQRVRSDAHLHRLAAGRQELAVQEQALIQYLRKAILYSTIHYNTIYNITIYYNIYYILYYYTILYNILVYIAYSTIYFRIYHLLSSYQHSPSHCLPGASSRRSSGSCSCVASWLRAAATAPSRRSTCRALPLSSRKLQVMASCGAEAVRRSEIVFSI